MTNLGILVKSNNFSCKLMKDKSKLIFELKNIVGDNNIITSEWEKNHFPKDGDMEMEMQLPLSNQEN